MTRLYRLNPIAAGTRGMNIGITMPPAQISASERKWTDAGNLLIVTASGLATMGDSYAYPLFSAVASADRHQQWDLENTSERAVLCRVVPISGDLVDQFWGMSATYYTDSTLTMYPPDGSLQPYFVVPPNTTVVLFASSPESPDNIVGTVVFRVEAMVIE